MHALSSKKDSTAKLFYISTVQNMNQLDHMLTFTLSIFPIHIHIASRSTQWDVEGARALKTKLKTKEPVNENLYEQIIKVYNIFEILYIPNDTARGVRQGREREEKGRTSEESFCRGEMWLHMIDSCCLIISDVWFWDRG